MIEAIEVLKNSGKVIVDEDHDWGYQLRFVNDQYCGKFLVLENNNLGSFHFHHLKKETFVVLFGNVILNFENKTSEYLEPGDSITLYPNAGHSMKATIYPAIILEVSTHDEDSDTYRIGGEEE